MPSQTDVLKGLQDKEGPTKAGDLARELKTGEDSVRPLLAKLKKKTLVDGDGKGGWYITDAGKDTLASGQEIPTTTTDIGKDELSQFKRLGLLAGAEQDEIAAAAELFSGTDMRSMDEVKRVLAEVNIPMTARTKWENLYRNFLRLTTPPEERDEKYPLPRASEVKVKGEAAEGAGEPEGDSSGLNFIVEGGEMRRVADGMGDFTFKQGLQVLMAKRGVGGGGGSGMDLAGVLTAFANTVKTMKPDQTITVKDLMDWVDKIRGGSGDGNPGATGYIGEDGEYHQAAPGQPIVIRQKSDNPSGKVVVVKQTDKGIVTEEHPAGAPIIIQTGGPPAGSSTMPMMPFPVIGADGQPVVDKDGRPVYANIEPMLKWLGFVGEQRRAEETHQAVIGLAQAARETIGDGVQALKMAAEEWISRKKPEPPASETKATEQAYECGNCKTQFKLPAAQNWANLQCPGCGHVWTREEVLKA